MKIIIISSLLLCFVSLVWCKAVESGSRLPYLTDEDFERIKELSTESYVPNPASFQEHSPPQAESRMNVWINSRYKWPNARVPYVISSLYNEKERAVIAASIQEWELKTCMRFVPRTSQDADYIELTPNDGTNNYCYSYVGRQGGRQYVKMYSPTCMSVGQYVHELGHAIGFGHEHQRPDRDNYIEMKWENIDPAFYYAYDKYSASSFTTMGMTYDYYSIMHYPDYSYTSNGKPAFVPKFPGHSVTAMNVKLTPTDVEKTKKYYEC